MKQLPAPRVVTCAMERVLVAGLATALGCSDPTSAPPNVVPLVATASVSLPDSTGANSAMTDRTALAAAVSDALTRVVPTLGAGGAASQLQIAIEELQRSVESRDVPLAASVLRARRWLESLERQTDSDAGMAAELSALELVLDRASEIDSAPGRRARSSPRQ